MKIGINASFSRKPGTGIGQVTVHFLNSLFENKKFLSENHVVLFSEEKIPEEIALPKEVEVRSFLPFWKRDDLIRKIWWEKFSLPKAAQKEGCEVFLSLYQSPTIFPKKIKHLMLVHDLIPRLFPEYLDNFRKRSYQKMTEKAARKADKIIAISKRTEKDLIKELGISGEKITTAYIDVDPIYKKSPGAKNIQKILKKYKLKPGYILGGVGLDKRKNIEGLLMAYKKLLEENKKNNFLPEVPKLVIVGKLMPELAPLITDVQKIIKENNLGRTTRTLGFVPQKDMPALYNQAALFVYPSFYEGFGLPILEAMNQKTPVLTGKNSSLPEVGRDAVLYCEAEDSSEIYRIMKNILTNKKLSSTLSERGETRAKNFSWNNFSQKIIHLIKE